jgi:hypothetical protein
MEAESRNKTAARDQGDEGASAEIKGSLGANGQGTPRHIGLTMPIFTQEVITAPSQTWTAG